MFASHFTYKPNVFFSVIVFDGARLLVHLRMS